MNLIKMERYLRVNLLGPGPRLMKNEFTEPRSHKGWETLLYATQCCLQCALVQRIPLRRHMFPIHTLRSFYFPPVHHSFYT